MMRSRDCIPANRNRRSRPVVTERLVSFLEHRGAFWIAAPLVGTLGCSLRQESTRMLYADQSLSSHTAEDLPRMSVCDEPPNRFISRIAPSSIPALSEDWLQTPARTHERVSHPAEPRRESPPAGRYEASQSCYARACPKPQAQWL